MRKNSIKNTRINGEVLKELSAIIRDEIKDPRIHPFTSVTNVFVAPDLKTCKAYISVLGDENALKETVEGLRSAEGYIRRCLARTVNLRNTPEITFIPDTSIAYAISMSKKIDDLRSADEEDEPDAVTEETDDETAESEDEADEAEDEVNETGSEAEDAAGSPEQE